MVTFGCTRSFPEQNWKKVYCGQVLEAQLAISDAEAGQLGQGGFVVVFKEPLFYCFLVGFFSCDFYVDRSLDRVDNSVNMFTRTCVRVNNL